MNEELKPKTKKQNSGFTLIEIMVATAIFMIIMLAAIGALFVASNSAQKAKALRAAMDNVNFAMENMSRSLRVGSYYYCTTAPVNFPSSQTSYQDCDGSGGSASGGTAIVFTPYDITGQGVPPVAFQLSSSSIQKVSGSQAINITSPEVKITDLKFVVRGSGPNDGLQPSVYLIIKGSVSVRGEDTKFAIQTLASQRNAE